MNACAGSGNPSGSGWMRGQGAIIKRRSTRQTCSLEIENRSCLVEQVVMLLKQPIMYIDVRKCRRYLCNLWDGTESDSDTTGGLAIESSNCIQYFSAGIPPSTSEYRYRLLYSKIPVIQPSHRLAIGLALFTTLLCSLHAFVISWLLWSKTLWGCVDSWRSGRIY